MNYFQFYRIPVNFAIDKDLLNRKYFEYNKLYRPENYSLQSPEDQIKNIEFADLNNKAFRTLSDPVKRMRYILEIKGIFDKNTPLPISFLKTVNPIELEVKKQLERGEGDTQKIRSQIDQLEQESYEEVRSGVENYKDGVTSSEELKQVEIFYHKKEYLLRIRELLNTFEENF